MKKATRLKRQLKDVVKWLGYAREHWEKEDGVYARMPPYFKVMVAVEQLVKYIEMQNEDEE